MAASPRVFPHASLTRGERGGKPFGQEGMQACSFLKKRTKKLFIHLRPPQSHWRVQMGESLFASFSSEKEDSCFLLCRGRHT
jgi:hypothetical protein